MALSLHNNRASRQIAGPSLAYGEGLYLRNPAKQLDFRMSRKHCL
jgi:hypothetical protein